MEPRAGVETGKKEFPVAEFIELVKGSPFLFEKSHHLNRDRPKRNSR